MKKFRLYAAGLFSGVSRKITALFVAIFLLLLTPVVVQTYTAFHQARTYRDVVGSITYANQLATDVNSHIEPVVWNIVAGKVTFGESGVMPMVADIRERMNTIRGATSSAENRAVMEIALRALGTLENYLLRLSSQIDARFPVAENELLLEEIRVCIAGINDLLQEFSSGQVEEVSELNEEMYRRSFQGIAANILLILCTTVASAFAFRNLIRSSIEEEKKRQILEYRVLQEQITPHFLYNTLDAIIWAAEASDIAAVIKLVTALSSFFRTSLSRGVDFVPVASELEHVRSYLTIQQMRYNDILSYEIDADEELQNQIVPKLLLQPLVENSIYHGIKNTRGRGKITVSIKKEGKKIRFTVADNGIGMTPEKLRGVQNDLRRERSAEQTGGYGLFNVNRRLRLYYSMPGDIEIKSEHGKGTEVSFLLDIS